MTNPDIRSRTLAAMEKMAIPPAAVATAITFAIEQPSDVDVGEIVIRPTAPGVDKRFDEGCHMLGAMTIDPPRASL
jgi:hypothetical protein